MEVVVALCIQCNAELGRFRNSWNGIGNSYHSPVYPAVSARGLEATGDVYNGAKNSHIEHSLLQDIACINCQAVVGLRCESAPEGHLLKENQLIMRLTDMSVVTEDGGKKAKISILKSFPLSIKPSGSRRAATVQPSPRIANSAYGTPTPLHKAVVSRTPGPDGRLSHTPANVTMSQVTKFKNWAEGAINKQQKDIDRISGTVDRIERDMGLFKDFMLEIRSELSSSRQLSDSIGEEDQSALRDDLRELGQQVKKNGQAISRASDGLRERSLEVIAHNVEQISQKANEVDDLKSELERMKARVKSLEDFRHSKALGTATSSRQLRSAPGPNKRKQSQMDDSPGPSADLPTEPLQKKRRVALSSPHKENLGVTDDIAKTPDRQIAPVREIVEILSSEHDQSSPVRGQDDEQDQPNTPQNAENGMSSIPNSTSSALVLEESSGSRQGPASMQTPTADKGYSAIPRAGTSRIEIHVPHSAALAMSLQKQAVRVRDNDGVPNGKVGRRSRRFKGRKASKENIVPDGIDDNNQEEPGFMEPDRERAPVTRSKGSSKITSSMNPTTCNVCDRNFKNMFGFYSHKCMRSKTPGQNITARETVLAERDKLVRATLERGLGK